MSNSLTRGAGGGAYAETTQGSTPKFIKKKNKNPAERSPL